MKLRPMFFEPAGCYVFGVQDYGARLLKGIRVGVDRVFGFRASCSKRLLRQFGAF